MGPSFIPKPGGAWLQCWVTAAHQWWSSEMHPASFDPIFSSSLAQGPIKGAIWLISLIVSPDFSRYRGTAAAFTSLHFSRQSYECSPAFEQISPQVRVTERGEQKTIARMGQDHPRIIDAQYSAASNSQHLHLQTLTQLR